MTNPSILFCQDVSPAADPDAPSPPFWTDLHLDVIVAGIVHGREDYHLEPYFHLPLGDVEAIAWRQEVMRDLATPALLESIGNFAQGLRTVRERLELAERLPAEVQQWRWFLDAVDAYCGAVAGLAEELAAGGAASRGLTAFRQYLNGYLASAAFATLRDRSRALISGLAAIRYTISIQELRVRVQRNEGEADFSREIDAAFAVFPAGSAPARKFRFLDIPEANPVEARILDAVTTLYPELFAALADFCRTQRDFVHPVIARFDREVQFYAAYLEHMARLKAAGLEFCYPQVEESPDAGLAWERGFDLALAATLAPRARAIVRHEVHLGAGERLLVISGPNQGGKTTLARALGQLHYLAQLGLLVPGARARLQRIDAVATHFERAELSDPKAGKLYDDMVRVREIVDSATPRTLIVLNEIFASTTLRDAIALSRKIATRIEAQGALCVWVTFVDELASFNERTVSLAGVMDPARPAQRTYRFERRPADGRAYALAIAAVHHLGDEAIRQRLQSQRHGRSC